MDTWVWITVAAVVALSMVGVLAVLGSTLSERLRAAGQVGADADVDVDAAQHRH